MPRFHVQIRERHKLLILFLLGVAGSAVFIRQLGAGIEEEVRFGGSAFFMELAQTDGGGDILARLLWQRLWLPALWIGLSFTALGAAALYLFWAYMGFAMTVALWTAVAFGGWRGPFYFWGLLFPQYLVYIPALLLIYIGCRRWNQYWRGKRMTVKRMPGSGPQLRMFLLRITLGLALYGAGIWMESWWNPWILKRIFIKT